MSDLQDALEPDIVSMMEGWAVSQSEYRYVHAVVDAARRWAAVQEAISNEGSHPRYHQIVLDRHRREWPTLWAALE